MELVDAALLVEEAVSDEDVAVEDAVAVEEAVDETVERVDEAAEDVAMVELAAEVELTVGTMLELLGAAEPPSTPNCSL